MNYEWTESETVPALHPTLLNKDNINKNLLIRVLSGVLFCTCQRLHWDFENRCRNGWENWSWSWQPSFEKWQKDRKMISVLKVSISTSIISAIFGAIVKISVPIIKRRSWGFQNTPNLQSLHKIWLIKQPKQSGSHTAFQNQISNQFWKTLIFFQLQ